MEKAAVMISANAVWFINNSATGGDCTSIGTWNVASKTCTLTTDLTETIVMDSDGITIDGNGHTITGNSYSKDGIYLSGRNGVTIKNTNVRNFSHGINLDHSRNNTLSGNNASNNDYGIYLDSSSNNNTLSGNNANSNNFVGIGLDRSSSNTLIGNNANSNKYVGIGLQDSSNNMLSGNNANSKNGDIGIILWYSSSNTLNGNNASNNHFGIILESSNNNTLSGNNANSNNNNGIYFIYSSNNNLTSNTASSNRNEGIYLSYPSNDNTFYNNFFSNTINFGGGLTSGNTWNITKASGINIVGGPKIGGNFWANPNGTGFSQTCADSNSDGICDSPYTLDSSNIDYLPLGNNAGSGGGGGVINGQVAYGPMTWNASNFPAFWHQDNVSSEVLAVHQPDLSSGQRTINLDELSYNTTAQIIPYKVYSETGLTVPSALDASGMKVPTEGGYYAKLGFFARPYVALNGKSNKLAQLIIEQGTSSSEYKTLAVGETWDIGGGWTLTAQAIDAKAIPRQAWFALSKDGVKIDDRVIAEGQVYTYTEKSIAGESDVPLFVTYVDSMFAGAMSDIVRLRYTRAISNVTQVAPGNVYGVFMVTDDGSGYDRTIKLWNDVSSISLSRGSTINLFDGLYFVVNDNPSLEYYPEMSGGGGNGGFVDDIAIFQLNGWWATKYNFNSAANGSADKWLPFGDGTAKPVVGDFRHTGTPSDVAILQSNGWWAIKYDFNNAINGTADKWIAFGDGTAKPVVGDFDHDGFKDDVAILQSNGWWAIKYDFVNTTNFAGADKWIAFGDGTAQPVVGDFNGDGFADDVALLQSNGWWALKYNFNSTSNFAGADKWIAFGDGTAKPVVGDFERSGTQNDVALLQSNGWWAIKYNLNSTSNLAGADKWVAFGDGTAQPVVGEFNNN